ncbi:MAG: hydrogenase iron-sulfur subunit [Bacteroidetes bacterium]|nr:hydrogenase iron-sulfur subunit [Bacteroidota bacterium]
MDKEKWEPKIVAFVCNWCTYTGADLAGTSRMKYPANAKMIRVMCSGSIDPVFIIKAFERGADGVLVSGCHPNDCHYNAGNFHARRRWDFFHELLDFIGIEKERLQFSWISASEGKKFADVIAKVTKDIKTLGPFTAYKKMNSEFTAVFPEIQEVVKETIIKEKETV